jgi:hypothetical protein
MPNTISSTALLALTLTAAALSGCASATDTATDTTGAAAAGTGETSAAPTAPAETPLASAEVPATIGTKKSALEPDLAPASGTTPAPAAAPAPVPGAPPSLERQVVAKLGLGESFLIGLGNDATTSDPGQAHAYGLGQKVDLHYMYLSGLTWPEWNTPAGSYVGLQANAAKSRGVVPMFTLYQAASYGENNLGAFNTTSFMTAYWRGVRLMFEQLAAFDSPAVVHIEPDLWGYTQAHSELPSGTPMKVGEIVPECTDLPSDVSGMARCVIRLSRQIAPKVVIGLSASTFGAFTNGVSDPTRVGNYLNAIGAGEADITVLETLDRDAGCFEVGSDPNCQRNGSFYWDEANVAHPNFHDHLAWAKTIRDVVGKPLLWWQMPLGTPSGSSGSSAHYRDNRVHYLFAHADEFAAVGGIGAVFGTGAPNQTTAVTDGGQFKTALANYATSRAALLP